jgi:crotonobetainyl-CoA:carnitine CoA-transferase CaiB-like acyl-CoA transferase
MTAAADVVIEGFRPGVVDRLGIGFCAVKAINPRIVYASLTGYGSDGPLRDIAGHDINYIARAGVLGMTGTPDGRITMPGVQVGDLGGATILGIGILAALHHATRTGEGLQVEVSMYDAAMAWTSIHAGAYFASGQIPDPGRMLLNGQVPCYNVYESADGRYLSIGAVEPKFWENFCRAVGREDLISRHMDEDAREDMAALIATRSRDDWVRLLDGVDACVAPVLNLGEALENPLARERGMVQTGRVSSDSELTAPTLGTPIRIGGRVQGIGSPPPRLGEHTREVAREAGFTDQEIDGLIGDGVLASQRLVQT